MLETKILLLPITSIITLKTQNKNDGNGDFKHKFWNEYLLQKIYFISLWSSCLFFSLSKFHKRWRGTRKNTKQNVFYEPLRSFITFDNVLFYIVLKVLFFLFPQWIFWDLDLDVKISALSNFISCNLIIVELDCQYFFAKWNAKFANRTTNF